jgi:hypothetical protein
MRTRRGACYSCHAEEARRRKRRRSAAEGPSPAGCAGDMLEELPDDLVVSILAYVAATAGSPADLAGAMLTYVLLLVLTRLRGQRNGWGLWCSDVFWTCSGARGSESSGGAGWCWRGRRRGASPCGPRPGPTTRTGSCSGARTRATWRRATSWAW